MMDLCELSNAKLIGKIKSNPNESAYLVELNKRIGNNELSDADLIKLLDVIIGIGGE